MVMIEVSTYDAQMEFEMDQRSLGKQLFDQVSRTIGLREVWYFGLQYTDSKGYVSWLKLDKRICDQDVPLESPATHHKMQLKSSPSGSTSSTTSVGVTQAASHTSLNNMSNTSGNQLFNGHQMMNGAVGRGVSTEGPSSKTSSTSSVSTATSSTSGQSSNQHLSHARTSGLGTFKNMMMSSSVGSMILTSDNSSKSSGSNGKKDNRMMFNFIVKYFPEDVAEELIQEVTQRMFYLQVKQAILSMDIFCPPEASVLLASYAVQAKYGDYDEATYRPGMLVDGAEDLLPQSVIDQYQMTPEMWEERIRVWYADHKGMSRDEAELEYLKIAQDLDMYGVNYFLISNKKESQLWLGVTSTGLSIYEMENKLNPKITFAWSEIRNISYDDKRFSIKPVDNKSAPVFYFYSSKTRLNKIILELCIGNHDLYMKRRQPDSMELQQMKSQAKEEKERRNLERLKLQKEKALRETAEREKKEMMEKLLEYQKDARDAQELLKRSEELAELLAEKVKIAEEESLLLSQKSFEAENQIQRIKISAIKTEEEKILMEKKASEAESFLETMIQESEARAKEAEALRYELIHAKIAEKEARDHLSQVLRSTSSYTPPSIGSAGLSHSSSSSSAGHHLYHHHPLMINTASVGGATGVVSSNSNQALATHHHLLTQGHNLSTSHNNQLHPHHPHQNHHAHHQQQQHFQQHQQPRAVPVSSSITSTSPLLNTNGTNIYIQGNLNGINNNHNPEQLNHHNENQHRHQDLTYDTYGYSRVNQSGAVVSNGQLMLTSSSPPAYSNLYSDLQNYSHHNHQQQHQQLMQHENHQRVNSIQNETNILNKLRASIAASNNINNNNNSNGNNGHLMMSHSVTSSPLAASTSGGQMYQHQNNNNHNQQNRPHSAQATNGHLMSVKAVSPNVVNSYSPVVSNSSQIQLGNSTFYGVSSPSTQQQQQSSPSSGLGSTDLLTEYDVEKLAQEVEKERMDYLERSKLIQNQLKGLRTEIQVLKVDEKLTQLDKIWEENSTKGETNKYSTLKRTKSGSTKARVSFFEEL